MDCYIGMTMDEVKEAIGEPDEIRGSIKNDNAETITVWQYNLYEKNAPGINLAVGFFTIGITWLVPLSGGDAYWIFFVENHLAQFSRAGDWQPDEIKKIELEVY